MAKRSGAGSMREKLHFQRREALDDGMGNETSGPFSTVFTDAAEIIPLRGTETVMASRLAGVQPYIVRIHSNIRTRAVTPTWRIVDARNPLRVLNIRTVTNNDQKNAYLDLMVDDGVAT